MSRVMDMACVALPWPCLLLPASPATWYGLTAWLLCSLRLLAGRRLCQSMSVCRDGSHCTSVAAALYRTLGREINSEQAKGILLQAAVIASFKPTDSNSHGHKYRAACWPSLPVPATYFACENIEGSLELQHAPNHRA